MHYEMLVIEIHNELQNAVEVFPACIMKIHVTFGALAPRVPLAYSTARLLRCMSYVVIPVIIANCLRNTTGDLLRIPGQNRKYKV